MKKMGFLLAVVLACAVIGIGLEQAGRADVDQKSIDGVVVNANSHSPEAGVWVVAENKGLPTPFRKIVVTNDEGKFVVPDLPKGDYQVWVRGYGLKDSAPVKASPGAARLSLQVNGAKDPIEAAQVYPANYWLSIYQPPAQGDLPKDFKTQDQWLANFKLRCMLCHQIGIKEIRSHTTPAEFDKAWHLAGVMNNSADGLGREALAKSLADWGSRIAAGEVPPAPPRPSGIERNIVVTEWQWGLWDSYIHDEVSTDKRNPSLYPYGKVFGVDYGQDFLWAIDPVTNKVSSYKVPTRDGYSKLNGFKSWTVYTAAAHPHNPMFDDKGHVWITTQVRDNTQEPKWAPDVVSTKTPEEAAIAKEMILKNRIGHNLGYFDIKTEKFVLIDTAYSTHHLQFDNQGKIWTTTDRMALGSFDPTKFDPANPRETEEHAQKAYVAIDVKSGQPSSGGGYGVAVNPVDQTIWRATPGAGGEEGEGAGPGNTINKFDPKTETFTTYHLPLPGRGPRGIDATTDGMIWFATGSGHLGRFNPQTEKFTYWETPGPKIKGTGSETGSADFHYYIWVDQFNTMGLGKDMVVVTGTDSDSLLVFNPSTEKFTVIRIPYPMGFFHRGLDGRIDDANAGWKGRGLWADYGMDPVRLVEGHMGNAVHFQLRPDPLAH